MKETKNNDLEIIPVGQLDEQRREEVLIRLEKVEYEIEELKTLQVGE